MISVELSQVCALITDGTHYTPEHIEAGKPFLTVKDMLPIGLDLQNCAFISEADFEVAKKGNSAPQVGDVLFSKDGTVGKVHVVTEPDNFAVLSSIAILRPDPKQLDAGYLGKVLSDPSFLEQATRKKTGSAIRRVVLKDIKTLRVPLPSINEQRRIASIMDKADAIRLKTQHSISLADELLRATFLEMFGDPVVNPKGYPEHALGKLVDVRDGTHDSPKYVDEGYPLITSKNVTGGRLDFSKARNISERDFIEIGKRSSVEKGNILMPMIGTIGKPIIVDTDRQFAIKNVALLRTDGADPLTVFLLELLKGHYLSHAILKSSRGGTQKFIALSDIRSLPICLPPKEQLLEFSSIVQKIEGLKVQMENACVYSDQFFDASSQRLFRGDL